MLQDDRKIVGRRHRSAPKIPSGCVNCTVRNTTLCRAFSNKLDVVQNFKSGDRILAADTHLYRIGDRPGDLFNLLDGWIALYRILESGKRQILDILLPGAFVGYQADLNEPMLHGAVCLSDVSVCVFPRKNFPALVEQHPGLATALVDVTARAAVRAQDQLTNIGGRVGTTRVAHMLLDLFLRGRRAIPGAQRDTVELPLTQELIADSLGLTSVYVNRILRHLRERGLVVLRNGKLKILDLEALAQLAELSTITAVDTRSEPTPLRTTTHLAGDASMGFRVAGR
jgi:CRP/FNR family transcriptional regulator